MDLMKEISEIIDQHVKNWVTHYEIVIAILVDRLGGEVDISFEEIAKNYKLSIDKTETGFRITSLGGK